MKDCWPPADSFAYESSPQIRCRPPLLLALKPRVTASERLGHGDRLCVTGHSKPSTMLRLQRDSVRCDLPECR